MADGGDSERSEPAPIGRCPICGKPRTHHYRPFCSKRCANIDLARWMNGGYCIEGGNQHADEDGEGDIPEPPKGTPDANA